jgi:signal transduction histidine kinase
MSEQMASNRYRDPSLRTLNALGPQFGDTAAMPVPKTQGRLARGFSNNAVESPARSGRGRAHARDKLNSQVAAVLSHELRNSLCVIRMATGMLEADLSASAAVEKARALIEHQTAHMSRLVEDLLDTSRLRNGDLALKCEKLSLGVVTAQALQSVEFTMQRRSHSVAVSQPVEPLWLMGDPARLEQVFVNLLLNAAKYTPPGGNIRLSVDREAGEAVVRICDNGIGIAPDVLPRVFDLFVQGHPSSSDGDDGLGIGLALVRNLVDRHGGCVTAASLGLGQGSEFVVRLPMPD